MSIDSIIIRKPDDMHVHFRDGIHLQAYVRATAEHFARAIVMPNLKPPVTTLVQVVSYRARIASPESFEPLMTLYLTDNTSENDIRLGKELGLIHGVKLYPAGATTNSDAGVTDLRKVYETFAVMQEVDLPLLVHGEVVGDHVDIFDREKKFLDQFWELSYQFPQLRMVLEHITTEEAAKCIADMPEKARVAATITAHHLLENRNAIFRGGINPHNYCLPVLKREEDRVGLLKAATSGSPRFFAGTDSAPHLRHTKETTCGCAGCFTAPHAMALYATAFDQVDRLDALEAFTSVHGAQFYGLPLNEDMITLRRVEPYAVADRFVVDGGEVIPFWAGKALTWMVE